MQGEAEIDATESKHPRRGRSTPASARNEFWSRQLERFVPDHLDDGAQRQRYRAAVLQTWAGVGLTLALGILYASAGSPISGCGILSLTVGLLLSLVGLRRGLPLPAIGNFLIALTWLVTALVASRSGGFSSPALVWCFLLPLCTYSVFGRSTAAFWALMAAVQFLAFFFAEWLGVRFETDFSASTLSMLRVSGYLGTVVAGVVMVSLVDDVRSSAVRMQARATRSLERERLVADIHDGIGSQLGVIATLAGSGKLDARQLADDLTGCLDDLRWIVDSLDADSGRIDFALGEVRARLAPRCGALGVELSWQVADDLRDEWPATSVLQVVRSAQELVSNALRHAQCKHITLTLSDSHRIPGWVELVVDDDGVGLVPRANSVGRGLKNLKLRAESLGGQFALQELCTGLRAVLEFPRPS